MNSNGLTRRQESLIRSLYTRHGRRKAKCCVCEGLRAARELYTLRPDLVRFTVATEAGSNALAIPGECCIVGEEKMRELSGTVNSQGILAVAAIPEEPSPDERPADPFLFAVDRLGDPGNFGTIIRLCDWFGVRNIFCSPNTVDVYNHKVVQATMGAISRVRVKYCKLDVLLKQYSDMPIYGTALNGKNIYKAELSGTGFVIFGNEGRGMSQTLSDLTKANLRIPPFPATAVTSESLNVGVAAAITIAEFRRQMSVKKV